ncbi:FK506-binding protein 3 [Boeremia exigua]|uniref:FK506-binding protein 3 n=1 Tax=Boeremia exigua TaxID=749465 RepID=UPI001E8DA68C|nr:FK506-binding protein 3 [Boeremia exigua]KAH6644445.1 FK506-binding protein 3 [Boeremia exigua]
MPSAVPAGVYGRRIPVGGLPIPAAVDPSAAFRITMAAIDPSAEPQIDEEHKVPRATLRIIRVPMDLDDEDDEEDDEDFDGEDVESIIAKLRAGGVALPEEDEDSEDESDDEANGGPSDKAKSKKAKQAALKKKLAQDLAEDEMEIDAVNGKGKNKISADEDSDEDDLDDEDEDDEEEDEVEEFVLCTLDPERNYQQPLDITVREGEEVYLQVDGTHDVYVTGNYIAFPEDDDEDEEDEYDEEYDLSPDEDELDLDEMDESEEDELDGLENPRITEVDSEEEAPKLVEGKKGKNKNKRAAEAESLDDLISKAATNGEQKAAKKVKKNDGQAVAAAQETAKKAEKVETPSSDKKKVQFSKNLEMGPTGSPRVDEKKEAAKPAAKGPRNVSGVTVDDKKEGKGKAAKKGDRVEMRYIGKLKNGKVFDSNKKGKPFAFKLGVGQVIKGWDVGVAGMTAGGERRLTIPAAMAYGKKGAPPDIPPNSDLIFDIKCISVN